MKCKLCNSELDKVFYHSEKHWKNIVENIYDDRYSLYRCPICGLIYALDAEE